MENEVGIKRIVVVGTCGSGKTTLANELARRMGVPHVELDALHWGPNWTPVETYLFRSRTEEALTGDAWTVDGNYSKVRDIVWARAEVIVWLNYSLPTIFKQLFVREMRRGWRREVMWGNNPTLWRDVLGRESLFWEVLPSTRKHRRRLPILFQEQQYGHLNKVILKTPKDTHTWVSQLRIEDKRLFF